MYLRLLMLTALEASPHMDLSIEPIETIGSAVVLLLTMVYYNRGLDTKIDDTRHSLNAKIDDTRQALDAKIDDTRRELKSDIASVEEKADRANQYHIEIRGDLKALTEKVDCIQKQVDSIERRIA